jgi:hypothetical protein
VQAHLKSCGFATTARLAEERVARCCARLAM